MSGTSALDSSRANRFRFFFEKYEIYISIGSELLLRRISTIIQTYIQFIINYFLKVKYQTYRSWAKIFIKLVHVCLQ